MFARAPEAVATRVVRSAARIQSVDAVRGLIIMIMALDHTRDFFHSAALVFPPEDLTRTWAALFFTRWITHFCAPGFALLAGASAWLWRERSGRTVSELSRFLLVRGLWLVFLDVVVMRLAMFFGLFSGPVVLLVLWSLGWSMVLLAALVHLPLRLLAVFSLLVIGLHNVFDGVQASSLGSAAWIWNVLHQPGAFVVAGAVIVVGYPLVPWFAVVASGYCMGTLFSAESSSRRRVLGSLGVALTMLFVALRALNIYGDPRRWSAALHPVLSFLNTTKYPPSLLFLLMTLGPVLLLLAWFDGVSLSKRNPLLVFGKVPLFFFVVHFFLIHLLAIPVAAVRYGAWRFLLKPMPSLGGRLEDYPAGYGYPLWAVYLVWLFVLALMYPACVYIGRLKAERRSKWLAFV